MYLFGGSPGVVGTVVTEGALPFAVIIGGGNAIPLLPTPAIMKAVITGFKMSDRSSLGLAPTLRDRLYVWLFGEKPGVARVSGLAFPDICGTGGPSAGSWTGLDTVHSYFEQARANTYGLPCRLIFGPNTVRAGFLEEYDFTIEDANSGVGTFEFRFRTIPRSQIIGSVLPPVWAQLGS